MLLQDAQERQPVHAWHFDVQRQHIGFQVQDFVPGDVGVAGAAHDLDCGVIVQRPGDGLAHDCRVVHHQHADLFVQVHANCIRFSAWLIEC